MESDRFTFDWSPRRWLCPRLATTLGLSIFVHLLVALLFVIVTPEKVTSPSPTPEISLLSENNPEHRAILNSLASESPIGALAHQLLPVGNLAEAAYQYSFSQSQLVPLPAPRWTNPVANPLPKLPLPSGNTLAPLPSAPPSPPLSPFSGSLTLSPALASRLPVSPTIPPSPTRQLLEPMTFLLGVRGQGNVAFLMLQKSSGDSAADSAAESFLRTLTFQQTDSSLEWGHITLLLKSPVTP